jgi:hypothetical protein
MGADKKAQAKFDKRLGRCYELAGRRVLDDPTAILVHGTVQRDPYPPNPHAWVILANGNVWEPITEWELPPAAFTAIFNAEFTNRYSNQEARAQMVATELFGPWPRKGDA